VVINKKKPPLARSQQKHSAPREQGGENCAKRVAIFLCLGRVARTQPAKWMERKTSSGHQKTSYKFGAAFCIASGYLKHRNNLLAAAAATPHSPRRRLRWCPCVCVRERERKAARRSLLFYFICYISGRSRLAYHSPFISAREPLH